MMLGAEFAFWLAIAVMVACSMYFGPRIKSNRIAMQWGTDGKPTWHAPKQIALWGIVALALIVRLLIWMAMTHSPEKVNDPELGLLFFSIVIAAAHYWVLRKAARAE